MRQKSVLNLAARTSLVLFMIVLGLLILPVAPRAADAVELTDGQSLAEHSTTTSVNVQSAISLALQDRVDLDITPKAQGTFQSTTAQVAVATNNATGYGIYLGTTNGSSALQFLGNAGMSEIAPVTGSVTADNFGENTWGYCINAASKDACATYQAVPAETTQITNVPTHDILADKDTFDLSFAAKVNTSLPAGHYTNDVVVSVVANPREIQMLSDAIYMQDLDGTKDQKSKICANSPVNDTTQLIDARDGKKYWVAKLADGNCWMTQNLALNLDTNKPLTPADSDVATSWKPAYSTSTANNFGATGDSDTGYSWSLGEYVLATPQRGVVCANGSDQYGSYSLAVGQTLDKCPDFQKIDSDWSYIDAETGEWNGYNGLVAANKADKTYDSHYLIGNYYQFKAAIAGSTISNSVATASICPKGWQLPIASGAKSYANLFSQYGITTQLTGTVDGQTYNVTSAPLYISRVGNVTPPLKVYRSAGLSSFIRTASVSGSDYSYALSVHNAVSTTQNNKYDAYSVRCVAR